MVSLKQDSSIPKTPFLRRKHHERVFLTPDDMPVSPSPDSAVGFSPWHRQYPTLNVQPIPIDGQLRRKPIPEHMIVSPHSGQTSPVGFPTLEPFFPVTMHTSIPISTSRQPSPLSISTPQSTSRASTAPTTPVSTQAWPPVEVGLLYSNFPDPCGFSGLNKGLFGRNFTTAPQLPPLNTDSTPFKAKKASARKVKASKIPTSMKKTPKIESVAEAIQSAASSADLTPSKAQKVLGKKAGAHEALYFNEVEIAKKKGYRKSRIPSALRSLSQFGLSGVKDEDFHGVLPNRPLLTTTPSPTRSGFPQISAPTNFVHGSGILRGQSPCNTTPEPSPATRSKSPRISAPYNHFHVSGSDLSTGESPRTNPWQPSPPHTPHALTSITEAYEPSKKPKAVARNERVLSKTPAVLRASDFNFFHGDSGKASGCNQSRSNDPRSPYNGSSTTPDQYGRRYPPNTTEDESLEKSPSTPSRLPMARKVYGKQVMKDVQARMTTPQHRSMLPLAGELNT